MASALQVRRCIGVHHRAVIGGAVLIAVAIGVFVRVQMLLDRFHQGADDALTIYFDAFLVGSRKGIDYEWLSWLENQGGDCSRCFVGQMRNIGDGARVYPEPRWRVSDFREEVVGWQYHIAAVALFVGLWIIFRKVVRGLAWARKGKCIRCGYDLRGSMDGRCSECGLADSAIHQGD